MSAHAYTEAQLLERTTINWSVLKARGWVSDTVLISGESELREHLLLLASGLGVPVATRSGGGLCDTLTPTDADAAKFRSLSKCHALGEFPLHIDTAHWLTPCRYVVLACASPGGGSRPTKLMDTRGLPLDEYNTSLLHSIPLRVTNARYSFFSTILSKQRPFVRFDAACMSAATPDGEQALRVLSRSNWPKFVESVDWETGKVLIIDNWRILHGRGHAERPDSDRKLLRVSIR